MTAKKELNRYSKSKSTFKKSLIVAGLLTFYAIAPLSLKFTPRFDESRTLLQTLMTILGTFTISAATCALYMKKQNLYFKNAVENIDSKTQYKQEDDEETIEDLIKEISQIEFEMQEQKSMFEVVEENKKTKYEYKFDEYQPELYYEQQPCEIVEEKGNQYTLRIPQKRL